MKPKNTDRLYYTLWAAIALFMFIQPAAQAHDVEEWQFYDLQQQIRDLESRIEDLEGRTPIRRHLPPPSPESIKWRACVSAATKGDNTLEEVRKCNDALADAS